MPPKRGWSLRVADILESITKIQSYTEGMDFESFAWDERTVDAVIRHFGVSKEIIWKTLKEDLPPLIAPLNAILRREP